MKHAALVGLAVVDLARFAASGHEPPALESSPGCPVDEPIVEVRPELVEDPTRQIRRAVVLRVPYSIAFGVNGISFAVNGIPLGIKGTKTLIY